MRISDWSSDVCSSDLLPFPVYRKGIARDPGLRAGDQPLLPQKLVDEGGLACIRPADDGEFQRPVGAVFPLDVFSRFDLARLDKGIDIGAQRNVQLDHRPDGRSEGQEWGSTVGTRWGAFH